MIKDKVSPALFAAAALCFLLPFVTVSSNGAKVGEFSGVHVLRGETLQLPQAGDAAQQVDWRCIRRWEDSSEPEHCSS